MAIELTSANFAEFTDGIVDFYATWCGPCKMLSPVLDEVSEEMGLSVGKVNVDEELAIARQFGIQAMPTLVFLKGGAEVGRVLGYRPKVQLADELAKAFG